jgi:metal-dependent HD superfamily phosphatase/phosphodiesterase
VPEGEQRVESLGVVPPVADQQLLAVHATVVHAWGASVHRQVSDVGSVSLARIPMRV